VGERWIAIQITASPARPSRPSLRRPGYSGGFPKCSACALPPPPATRSENRRSLGFAATKTYGGRRSRVLSSAASETRTTGGVRPQRNSSREGIGRCPDLRWPRASRPRSSQHESSPIFRVWCPGLAGAAPARSRGGRRRPPPLPPLGLPASPASATFSVRGRGGELLLSSTLAGRTECRDFAAAVRGHRHVKGPTRDLVAVSASAPRASGNYGGGPGRIRRRAPRRPAATSNAAMVRAVSTSTPSPIFLQISVGSRSTMTLAFCRSLSWGGDRSPEPCHEPAAPWRSRGAGRAARPLSSRKKKKTSPGGSPRNPLVVRNRRCARAASGGGPPSPCRIGRAVLAAVASTNRQSRAANARGVPWPAEAAPLFFFLFFFVFNRDRCFPFPNTRPASGRGAGGWPPHR